MGVSHPAAHHLGAAGLDGREQVQDALQRSLVVLHLLGGERLIQPLVPALTPPFPHISDLFLHKMLNTLLLNLLLASFALGKDGLMLGSWIVVVLTFDSLSMGRLMIPSITESRVFFSLSPALGFDSVATLGTSSCSEPELYALPSSELITVFLSKEVSR